MPERFECTTLAKKALHKYSSFPFLYIIGHAYDETIATGSNRSTSQQAKGVAHCITLLGEQIKRVHFTALSSTVVISVPMDVPSFFSAVH